MNSAFSAQSPFRITLPVMVGYIPLGVAFGVLFSELGYAWYYATLMSLAVYAGSAQILAVGLLGAGVSVAEIGLATLLLNARHVFYGLSMAARFPRARGKRAYLIFGLTDETYSVLAGLPPNSPPGLYLQVTALNQFYWVLGCTLGALLGTELPLNTEGLDFVLTALFVVLAIEQAYTIRQWQPFLVAGISALGAALLVGMDHFLVLALGLTTALLLFERRRGAPQ